jgi:hypothetical protein
MGLTSDTVGAPASNDVPEPEPPQHRNEFRHEPLDHVQPSIRFLSILPELSPEGLVQCKLKHFIVPELRDPIVQNEEGILPESKRKASI